MTPNTNPNPYANPDAARLAPALRASLALRALYEQYGYRLFRMGQFEEYALYMENKSFLASEQVIAFTDLDGRMLALKPDVTLSIVRHAEKDPPRAEKLYYHESVYRPGAGGRNFQEISQMGIEAIGPLDGYTMAEVTALAAESLALIGPRWLLEAGHMGFTAGLLAALGLAGAARAAALEALAAKNPDALAAAAAAAGLPTADGQALAALAGLYGPAGAVLERARPLCRSPQMQAALDQLAAAVAAVGQPGQGALQLDLSLVNDTDYYNGLLLRGYLLGLPRPVLTGGQYDSILKKFGKRGGGVGFAIDLSQLALLPGPGGGGGLDLLLRYDPATGPAAVLALLRQAAAAGLRARALPAGQSDAGLHPARVVEIGPDGLPKEGGAAGC